MFESRSDVVQFLAVAEAGEFDTAADRLAMSQPALARVVARLEHRFRGRLFERLPNGVRLTELGAALVEPARGIIREYRAAEDGIDAARSGHVAIFRVTANPLWSETVLAQAAARFQEAFPEIELALDTATRTEGIRRLANGESDMHCGGIDDGRRLPDLLRRERFLDATTGIVAARGHPLLTRKVTCDDLAGSPWIDVDARAGALPGNQRPSLGTLLQQLHETTRIRVSTIVRTGSAGLHLMARGPYLAWLSLDFLDRLPEPVLRPLPTTLGRFHYRSGFVARRSAEDLVPFRRLEALVREIALGLQP